MRSIPGLALVLLAACGGASSKPATPGPTPVEPAPADDDPSCPVAVPGTSVTVEETDRGVALVFVTTGDVTELRERAATMATMHDEHHAAMSGGAGADHSMHAGGMIRVHSQATAEEIDGGARIVFTAAAPADRTNLLEELQMHARHLGSGTCKMDGEGHDHAGHGAPAEPAEPAEPSPPAPDPAQQLAAAELAAYEQAKPVLEKYCAGCHVKGGKNAKPKTLAHLDMTAYPFTGHHAEEISGEIREVLGATGKKATMPRSKPGSVKGEELALILAWADAFDAAHAASAPPAATGHDHH